MGLLAQDTAETLNPLGDDLLPWLVLALGAALAVGTLLALFRPNPDDHDGAELTRPPLARSLVMIGIGTLATIWGVASLAS